MTVIRHRWSADCFECELRETFTDYNERDRWITEHRRRYDHRVIAGTAVKKLDIPAPVTRSQAIANIANILGIAGIVEDVRL